MNDYRIVQPSNYTDEHKECINRYQETIKCHEKHSVDLIHTLKDINSLFICSTDFHAKLLGFNNADELVGMSDYQIPNPTISIHAREFVNEDAFIIQNKSINKLFHSLTIFHYNGGIRFVLISKSLFVHKPSKSILGIKFEGREINLFSLIKLVLELTPPQNNANELLENKNLIEKINNVKLTEYQELVAFFIAHIGLNYDHVAKIIDIIIPLANPRKANKIIKIKDLFFIILLII